MLVTQHEGVQRAAFGPCSGRVRATGNNDG
jgi:hypothetical protein